MTTFLLSLLGQRQRDKAARARSHQDSFSAGTLGHLHAKAWADWYEMSAEWLDGLERWRRVYRIACLYPIPWAIAERYEREWGDGAAEEIERRLRGGSEP